MNSTSIWRTSNQYDNCILIGYGTGRMAKAAREPQSEAKIPVVFNGCYPGPLSGNSVLLNSIVAIKLTSPERALCFSSPSNASQILFANMK
ncbi:MAG: hypothetical protein KC519_17815, partial [Anaerolineae bacterium]|nr:hypothetical protein [Anaerolineae bacterium]